MNRAVRSFALLSALATLAGCSTTQTPETAQIINPRQPAFVSMSSGDSLGSVFVQNRMYMARKNGENSAYAAVLPYNGEDEGQ